MKKIISLIASMGIVSISSQSLLLVQSCEAFDFNYTGNISGDGFTDDSYKDYVELEKSNGSSEFKFQGSTSTGVSASWVISDSDASAKLKLLKNIFISADYENDKFSNTDDGNVIVKKGDSGDSIIGTNEIVEANKDDSISIECSDVSSGALKIEYYSSNDTSSLSFVLSVYIRAEEA